MEGLKILYLITKATAGGAQLYVEQLATAARVSGAEVAVAYGIPGQLAEMLSNKAIRTLPISGLTRNVHLFEELKAFKDLVVLLRNERPAVVHLNSSKAGALGALAARISGCKTVVFTAHGWPHKEPRPFMARFLIWLASWITVGLVTKVIVVSEDDYRRAPVLFSRKKLYLIHNGIEHIEFLAKVEARTALAPEARNVTWILTLGELHSNKGTDVLIKAYAELLHSHPETRLIIIGGGERKAELRTLIKELGLEDQVMLTGFLAEGRKYLLAADIFAFPSLKEGLPFALLEAGYAGLPVVASRVGGIPEVIHDKESGILVPPQNPHALARAIRTLLEDPALAKKYGDALKARVTEKFSKERMVTDTFALYR
jgi:glycosyltransferase involved in cell wall biosynthesis